jgi:6-phosphogluconolactonase (cycloisomerase 2 family)
VWNQRSYNITRFKAHRETGLLSFTGQYAPVGTSSIMTFLS